MIFTQDNTGAINVINRLIKKNVLDNDLFLTKIDSLKIIQKLLVNLRELISANKDVIFCFTWVKAHTGKSDKDSIGNARADHLATLGLKLGFNSQTESNHISNNGTDIYYNYQPVAAFCEH